MGNIIILPIEYITKNNTNYWNLPIFMAELVVGKNNDGSFTVFKSRYSNNDCPYDIDGKDLRILITEKYLYV